MKVKVIITYTKEIDPDNYREINDDGKFGPVPNEEELKEFILEYDIDSGEFLSELKDEDIKIEFE